MVAALAIILALLASATVIVASGDEFYDPFQSEQEIELLSPSGSSGASSKQVLSARYGSADDMVSAFSTEWPVFLEIMNSEARAHCCTGRDATTRAIFEDIYGLLGRAWVQPSGRELQQLSLAEVLQHVEVPDTVGMRYASICALLRITATFSQALSENDMHTKLNDFELALIRRAMDMVTILSVKRLSYACGCLWKCPRNTAEFRLRSAFHETEIGHYLWLENLAFVMPNIAFTFVAAYAFVIYSTDSPSEVLAFICGYFIFLVLRAIQFISYYTLV